MYMPDAIIKILQHPDFKRGIAWERKFFPAKELISDENEQSRNIYIVENGEVRILGHLSLDNGHAIRPGYCDLGPGAIFGELTLFNSEPRDSSVEAVSDCQVIIIDAPVLEEFLNSNPVLGYSFLKELYLLLVKRLRQTNNRVNSLFAWGLKAHGIDQHL
jgi:CRP/FNR family cyclic AMP-dependent transcriptional regulator